MIKNITLKVLLLVGVLSTACYCTGYGYGGHGLSGNGPYGYGTVSYGGFGGIGGYSGLGSYGRVGLGGYAGYGHGGNIGYGYGGYGHGGYGGYGLGGYGGYGLGGYNDYEDPYGHEDDHDDGDDCENAVSFVCTLPKEPGHKCSSKDIHGNPIQTKKSLIRWFYDESAGKCKPFVYTGCGGNNNRFENELSCNDVCKPKTCEKKSKSKKGKRFSPYHARRKQFDRYLARSYLLGKHYPYLNQYPGIRHPLGYAPFAQQYGLNAGSPLTAGYTPMYNSPANYQAQLSAAPSTYPTNPTYPSTYPSAPTYPSTPTYAGSQPARQQQSYSPSPAVQPFQIQQAYQPVATYSQTYQPATTYTQHSTDGNSPNLHNQQSSAGIAASGHPVYNDIAYNYNQVGNVQNQASQPLTGSQNVYSATYQANDYVAANAYGSQPTYSNQGYSQSPSQESQ